ncbi:MAG: hypothetical protein RR296_10455 [Clostridia bacterium]
MSTNMNPTTINAETARAETEFLVNCGKEIAEAKNNPTVIEINGEQFLFFHGSSQRVKPSDPEEEKQPASFEAFSLQGLVDYIKTDVDGMFKDPERRHIVRVTNVDRVEVITPVTGWHKKRYIVASCNALVPKIPFNTYLDAEDFQIMVQTRFRETDNRALVLKLSGSLRSEQNMQTADDGVSQKVTINKGVATAADVTVKNPVEMFPLRTFYEVEQPASPFVLRFNENAEAALFEGDGGAWKLKAVQNIMGWLSSQLVGCNVEVIA